MHVCHSQGEWAKQKVLSVFERGMVVGASHTVTHYNLPNAAGFFHAQQFPVYVMKGPLCEVFESTWASIPVECYRHLVESMTQ